MLSLMNDQSHHGYPDHCKISLLQGRLSVDSRLQGATKRYQKLTKGEFK
jgi:hypothetical protein